MEIRNLLKTKRALQRELQEVERDIITAVKEDSSSTMDEAQLIERIDCLQNELLNQNTRLACQERMLRFCQLSNVIRDTVCNGQPSTLMARADDDASKTEETYITGKLDHLADVGNTIVKHIHEIAKMESELMTKSKESLTLMEKARHLYKELSLLHENEPDEPTEERTVLEANKEKGEQIVIILTNVFTSLIHGSRVDWAADERLKNIVLFLGNK